MARRNSSSDALGVLILFIFSLIQLVITIIVKLIILIYELISFHVSGYKQKSGNSFIKTYFNKGNYGEFCLYRKVSRVLGKESVLTNLYLDNKNTDTTEIDVLAVSNKGIYVFEMKNYAGLIYGTDTDQFWTQVLNRRTKNQFYNPLRQNYAHQKAVERNLGVDSSFVIPVVVFSNRSQLKKIKLNKDQMVYQYRNALSFLKKNEKKGLDIISVQDRERYVIELLNKCNMSDEVKAKHIEQVKTLQSRKI